MLDHHQGASARLPLEELQMKFALIFNTEEIFSDSGDLRSTMENFLQGKLSFEESAKKLDRPPAEFSAVLGAVFHLAFPPHRAAQIIDLSEDCPPESTTPSEPTTKKEKTEAQPISLENAIALETQLFCSNLIGLSAYAWEMYQKHGRGFVLVDRTKLVAWYINIKGNTPEPKPTEAVGVMKELVENYNPTISLVLACGALTVDKAEIERNPLSVYCVTLPITPPEAFEQMCGKRDDFYEPFGEKSGLWRLVNPPAVDCEHCSNALFVYEK